MRFSPTTTLLSLAAAIAPPFAAASSSIRNPIGALSHVDNATIHTQNHRIHALSHFDLSFNLQNDLHVKLKLEPNHDILSEDTTVSYLAADGSVSYKENVDRLGHKVFKGTAWIQRPKVGQDKWRSAGWARVLITQDGTLPLFEGAFSIDHDHHHIMTSKNYLRTRHQHDPEIERVEDGHEYLVLYRDSDILPSPELYRQELKRGVEDVPTCQAGDLGFNMQPDHPVYVGMRKRSFGSMDFSHLFGKRQTDDVTGGNSAGVNLVSTIGQTQGCPNTRKVALVGVATDCTYTAEFNSSQSTRENIINQMNTASGVWEDAFKISLGLQNLTISDPSCPGTPSANSEWNQACSDSVTIQDRLNMFSAWRGNQQDDNSHWTLLSTCNTGSAVGLAWLGQACQQGVMNANASTTGNGMSDGAGQETVSGANVVIRTQGASEWQIIAHETGHTYGAVHDCTEQTCSSSNTVNAQQCCPLSADTCDADGQYIMNPSSTQGIKQFSPCSIGNICSAIGRNSVKTGCLSDNREVTTISGQQCGNGIVEQGEDCDCGGEEGCDNNECCDAKTCKYKNNAVCDDSNEDCCRNCQFASNGTVCREATSDCDLQEVCPGDSSYCPDDETVPDGDSCGDGLQCASGQCTSRDQQCKSVMGSYTQGNDTYACDSQNCALSCASPEFGRGVCYGLQQNFLDGTDCGGGGTCQNGRCRGASAVGQVKSWIDDHKAVVIGVCSAIGAILLLAIISCITRSCRRRRHAMKAPPPPPPGGWQGWNRPTYGPPMAQSWNPQHPSQGWFGQAQGGGRPVGSMAWHPPPPPPAYGGSQRYA